VKRHPLGWIGGAAAAGLLATLFGGSRPRKAPAGKHSPPSYPLPRAGWIAVALEIGKLLYPLLRPVMVDLVSNAAKSGLAKGSRLP
jgi:hypothetical protein